MMTNEKSIEIIKCAIAEVEWEYPINYSAAFDKAIESLEKQIPKKIKKECFSEIILDEVKLKLYDEFCPVCGRHIKKYEVENILNNFCSGCGQAIDWGEASNE